MRCLNDVQHDGKVTVSGSNKLYVLFDEIDKVMLDGLLIYEKANYIFR